MRPDIWHEDNRPALHYEITQLLYRYARAVDRRDWALLRPLFHPRSRDEHGHTAGSVDDFIASFAERSARIPEMMHLTSNILIHEVDEERRQAYVESSCVAWSRAMPGEIAPGSYYDSPLVDSGSPNSRLAAVANRYVDLIVEHEGSLAFLFRKVVYEWVSVTEVPTARPFHDGMWTSSRDDADPSYRTLAQLRSEYESHVA